MPRNQGRQCVTMKADRASRRDVVALQLSRAKLAVQKEKGLTSKADIKEERQSLQQEMKEHPDCPHQRAHKPPNCKPQAQVFT